MRLFAQGWSNRKDGPGFRRIFYLKGCNLRCRWCASPESISPEPEILFHSDRSDEEDLSFLCPNGAISGRTLDRTFCRNCPDPVCRELKHPALEWAGFDRTVDDLRNDLLSAASAWTTFGGVTFGGGEPSLQAEELCRLLPLLRERGIHTAVESNASTPGFPALVRTSDLVIADLKAGTAENFRRNTGGNLADVLENLEDAAEHANDFLLRFPVITGRNDAPEELDAAADHALRLHAVRLRAKGIPLAAEVLRLHHFGEPKYRALGRNYELAGMPEPPQSAIRRLEERLARGGIQLQGN